MAIDQNIPDLSYNIAFIHQSTIRLPQIVLWNSLQFFQDEKDLQIEPTMDDLRQMKRAVRMNSVVRRKPGQRLSERRSILSHGEIYISCIMMSKSCCHIKELSTHYWLELTIIFSPNFETSINLQIFGPKIMVHSN